ncbi:copper amine oxidase N-terminal domain-containing protein [Paenibacillus sp. 19GGS1-52]|uniref:copper amine oxidase N-terminal domain-containing protein n=1 Tax=Paenibacillus sp. 19GGS1-52 TaxID=2758563 RepID=UPI001EFA4376|nr:copper amine oxidase N-terminal domain-containing protein [Paenibacillus sp. 19GGS1-52]
MKKMTCFILLILSLSLGIPTFSQAESLKSNANVHLKINQYFVLYSTPKAPYLSNGRLYIPLRSVSELLGGKATYEATTKLAKIELNNHKLEINTATNQTFYDGVMVQTEVETQLYQQSLFVPMRTLVESLMVNGTWNQQQQMFTLTNENLNKTPIFINIEEFDATDVYNQDVFLPISYTYDIKKEKNRYTLNLSVKAQNISGKDIPTGEEYLHPLYLFSNGGFSYDRKKGTRPAVKKNAIITRSWKRTELESFQYILFEGITGTDRTIDLP